VLMGGIRTGLVQHPVFFGLPAALAVATAEPASPRVTA